MNTVEQPAAEREPDHVTPGWTTTPAGYQVPDDLDDDPRLWTGEPIEPAPVEPERRTVSLEVLTDELRQFERARRLADTANAYFKHEPLDPAALVGVVLRVNGEATAVPDVDTDWRGVGLHRHKVAVLAQLLLQADYWADATTGAELLMPTPDVLAALDGRPDATFSAEPPLLSGGAVAAELRALAAIFDAHPDFPVQEFGLNVGQATDDIGDEDAVRRIGELLGLPIEETLRKDGRRSWAVRRYGPLAMSWSYIDGDAAVTE